MIINPLVTNGLSHPYHLDESTSIFKASGVIFMPPNLKKWGAYWFRLVGQFVRSFVHPSVRSKKNSS